MDKIFLTSTNKHKVGEIKNFTLDLNITISESPVKLEVEENGSTFYQNSLLKAQAYFKELKSPVLSDDSGLVILARPQMMGVHTALFMDHYPSYQDRCRELLSQVSDLQGDGRRAYFVCVLCLYLSDAEIYYFEGRVHGKLTLETKGEDGFGYDPLFAPDGVGGRTMAELPEWKKHNSHRSKAFAHLVQFMKKRQG